jgi:Holliday junction resolvasome RuvABC endonuclease subunit
VNLRLLAIDQGSVACGFAYFDDDDVRPRSTDLIRPRASLPKTERMRYIADQLQQTARTRGWLPDVVAIEGVAFHRNVVTAISMGETRGYLLRVVDELFPRAIKRDVNPSSTKAAARARMTRDASKDDIAHAVAVMTGLAGLSQDEADAVCVGWAAFKIIREQRLVEMADAADQMRLQATP